MGRVRGGTMTHVMLRQLFSISIYRSTSMSSSIAFDGEKQKNNMVFWLIGANAPIMKIYFKCILKKLKI
jgi:hypothetical protein